jgi:HlyD family secretion protein
MTVTSPKGWLALWTIGGGLLAIILWGIYGSIPTRVDGEGILIRGGTLRQIEASGEGELVALDIQLNDNVELGQVIGEIAQPALDDKITSARQKYEELKRDYDAANAQDRSSMRARKAELEKLEEELAKKKGLVERGLKPHKEVLALEREIINIEAIINQLSQKMGQRNLSAEAAKREWEELEKMEERSATVVSTVAGRVIELKKTKGDRVRRGDILAVLEPFSGGMEPVVYVPSTQGKLIKVGMDARISPSTVKKEEYGFMKGKVSSVGEYPVTPEYLQKVLANDSLARELLGNEAKLEVRATLSPHESTPSGYEWSSSDGPPFKIAGGTRVTISVVVDRRAPITYVLPIIKSTLGVS